MPNCPYTCVFIREAVTRASMVLSKNWRNLSVILHTSRFLLLSPLPSFSLTNAWIPLLTFCPSSFLSPTFAVIQDVDNASLQGQYQSFASLMEQRLAELFVLAGQQGTRFRRATAVGSYTVQVRAWNCSPLEEPHLPCTGLDSKNNKSCRIHTLKCCFIFWWGH